MNATQNTAIENGSICPAPAMQKKTWSMPKQNPSLDYNDHKRCKTEIVWCQCSQNLTIVQVSHSASHFVDLLLHPLRAVVWMWYSSLEKLKAIRICTFPISAALPVRHTTATILWWKWPCFPTNLKRVSLFVIFIQIPLLQVKLNAPF